MIGYYAHHHGSGHLTRLRAIAEHLRHPMTGLSSLPAPADWRADWLELELDTTVLPSGSNGDSTPGNGTAGDPSAGGVLHWAPPHHAGLARRTAKLAAWIADVRPALVVVDVSVEVALTARLCGIPVVVAALPGNRLDRPHTTAYDLADRLLAPWPRGVHDAGWPQRWRDKTWHVGGISRFDGQEAVKTLLRQRGRRVLLLWGTGGRATTAGQVAEAREATPDWTWVEVRPDWSAERVWAELSRADVVVTHAGQNAVAEVAAAARPAIVIAQPRPHGEQEATARALDRLGLAVGLTSWPDAARWDALLTQAHQHGGNRWERWQRGGSVRAAALLDARAHELTPARAAS